jgi:hypothetical protein
VIDDKNSLRAASSVPRNGDVGLENRLKAPLFVRVVQQDNRRNTQRKSATATLGRLTLKVLDESVGEMISRTGTPGSFVPFHPAMGTGEFDAVFQRITVQRSPTGVTNAHGFQRISMHESYLEISINYVL